MKFTGGDLLALKTHLANKIDTKAGEVRSAWVTIVPGQEMVYLTKKAEAEAIIAANGVIQLGEVPNVAAEAEDLGVELMTAAILVVTKAYEWAYISAEIERVRLAAKRGIAEAATTDEARAAYDGADWSNLIPSAQ